MSNLELFRPKRDGGLGLKLPSAYAEALRTSPLLDMTDESFATSLFLTRLRQTHENTLPEGIPRVTCKQLYEEEVLELAAKEGARPEAEGKDRRKGRIKRLYEERLKTFTNAQSGRDGELKMKRTAHEKYFNEEEMSRRSQLVGMKRISPAIRTSLHLMKSGCLATRDKAPKRGRKKQAKQAKQAEQEDEEELTSMCRRCGDEEETIEHLVKCKKNSNMAASLSEELVKGNGRVKWKGWLHKLERVAEGQAGRSRTQLEIILNYMKTVGEEEEEAEERDETQEESDIKAARDLREKENRAREQRKLTRQEKKKEREAEM